MIGRRQFLLGIGAMAALPGAAFAQAKLGPIEVAYLASFTCGKCATFDSRVGELQSRVGMPIHFVPITDREDDYVVRAWYGLRGAVGGDEALRTSLFKLTQKMMFPNPEIGELIEFLRLEGVGIPPDEIRKRITSEVTVERLKRAAYLASISGVEYTPAVVFTRGRSVLRAIENVDMSDGAFIDACVTAKRELEA